MIKEYSITNFKAFAGKQTIRLKPITLVYGPNSSGKSSLLQSLLMLKQTLESAENPETLLLPKGNLVDLGGFREFINSHDVNKVFAFEVHIPIEKGDHSVPRILQKPMELFQADSIGIRIEFIHDQKSATAKLNGIELYLGGSETPLFSFRAESDQGAPFVGRRLYFMADPTGSGLSNSVLRLKGINEAHPFWLTLWEHVIASVNKEAIPVLERRKELILKRLESVGAPPLARIDEGAKRPAEKRMERDLRDVESSLIKLREYTQADFLKDIFNQISKTTLLCRNFLPVGLIREQREEPKAVFVVLEELAGIGYDLSSIAALVVFVGRGIQESLEQTTYIGPLRDYPERHYIFSGNLTEQVGKSGRMVPDVLFKKRDLLAQVNNQLEAFGLGYELKVSSVNDQDSDLQDVFALRLYDKRTKVNASILDVGFGISQVLPVIVQSMLSKRKSLFIEQPEIHLHPKLQADLGTLIVNCAQPPLQNQFLIETHSQHLLLRIQKLIRQRRVSASDVSVLYVDRGQEGSRILNLRLDDEGDFIDKWPEGFFEEGYNEIFR